MQIIRNTQKLYDAVYVGRKTPFKRHYLAGKVKGLALVTGNLNGGIELDVLPEYVYRNDYELSPREVCQKINQSSVGLILSEEEGACYASSEYLLCGVPVVSTVSRGGRDVWYSEYNSIVVPPDPDAIAEAVEKLIQDKPDPQKIRKDHIDLAIAYREKFIEYLDELFQEYSINLCAKEFFSTSFFHKLRNSENPEFHNIWP